MDLYLDGKNVNDVDLFWFFELGYFKYFNLFLLFFLVNLFLVVRY